MGVGSASPARGERTICEKSKPGTLQIRDQPLHGRDDQLGAFDMIRMAKDPGWGENPLAGDADTEPVALQQQDLPANGLVGQAQGQCQLADPDGDTFFVGRKSNSAAYREVSAPCVRWRTFSTQIVFQMKARWKSPPIDATADEIHLAAQEVVVDAQHGTYIVRQVLARERPGSQIHTPRPRRYLDARRGFYNRKESSRPEAISAGSKRPYSIAGMTRVRRLVPVDEGLDVDDDFLAHVDAAPRSSPSPYAAGAPRSSA